MFRLSAFSIAAACLVNLAGAPVYAQDRDPYLREKVSGTVQIRDLDLATVNGRRALNRRVRGVVGMICTSSAARDLRRLADESRCRQEALRSAEPQVAVAVAAAARRDAAAIAAR